MTACPYSHEPEAYTDPLDICSGCDYPPQGCQEYAYRKREDWARTRAAFYPPAATVRVYEREEPCAD